MTKAKIGVFGLWRGMEYVRQFHKREDIEVWAVCDKMESRLQDAVAVCGPDVKQFTEYEDLLNSGIDAVFISNYFPDHAAAAIQAMEKGIHVISECTAAPTLAECVALCETVERTGCKYMLAENYPYMAGHMEMANLCQSGVLGRVLYAEAEYNHTGDRKELERLTPSPKHWRAYMPRTYYLTHTLGPLMAITGQMPVQVSAFAVHSYVLEQYDDFRHNYDALAMMQCITDDGALFRVSGCTAMCSKSGTRICGEAGCAETGRTLGGDVNLYFHPWTTPEGMHQNSTYTPENKGEGGHGGSDYWVAKNFADYLLRDVEPFFNVYRACAMSAVGILAWRSCLENGKTYAIPDFRDPAQRDAIRHDDLTPFPGETTEPTLPCAVRAQNKNAN